jgi:hypothetical protein
MEICSKENISGQTLLYIRQGRTKRRAQSEATKKYGSEAK